jgi:hypothetical protein
MSIRLLRTEKELTIRIRPRDLPDPVSNHQTGGLGNTHLNISSFVISYPYCSRKTLKNQLQLNPSPLSSKRAAYKKAALSSDVWSTEFFLKKFREKCLDAKKVGME